MNCPQCTKEMAVKSKDVSRNPGNAREYDRILYHCEADDVWISIETPKK